MEQTKYDIFISYRRKGGSEKAQLVKNEMKQRGVEEERIFLDTHSLHDGDFEQKIKGAIKQSLCVVVIISEGCFDAVKETDFWYMEIKEALLQGKKVVPIFFDGISSFSALNVPHELTELSKKNAVTYQHEYADAAFDKLVTFVGFQKETDNTAKKRGCLLSLKYKGCTVSVVLVSLGVFVLAPMMFMQLESTDYPEEHSIVVGNATTSGRPSENGWVSYAPNDGNTSECPSDNSTDSPEGHIVGNAPTSGRPSENDWFCYAPNDGNMPEGSTNSVEQPPKKATSEPALASVPPEKKTEELCGRWQGLDDKLVLSFRAEDVIMEKQDCGIVNTKHGEYTVKGDHIVFCWKRDEKQVVPFTIVGNELYLNFEDGQMIILTKQ